MRREGGEKQRREKEGGGRGGERREGGREGGRGNIQVCVQIFAG